MVNLGVVLGNNNDYNEVRSGQTGRLERESGNGMQRVMCLSRSAAGDHQHRLNPAIGE